MEKSMKKVVVIGAGPAGLTAAYELSKEKDEFDVVIYEESNTFGGISRTVNYKGNRMDMGGHRFFSKVDDVNKWWEAMMPTQGALSFDDRELSRKGHIVKNGPNPDKEDRVMLKRNRLSRIFFKKKFFDYPISLKFETIKNMGFLTTIVVGFSYLKGTIFKRKEESLEDFYINRFGRKLYEMFFEKYTENLWGRHPSEISPEWGAQRVKGLSIMAILKDIVQKKVGKKDRHVETSLIEEFSYPKLGPGQIWELTAEEIINNGATIITNAKVENVCTKDGKAIGVNVVENGKQKFVECDYVISSMPLKDLIVGMNDVPKPVLEVAQGLPYRDYVTVGILVKKLKLKNKTNIPTLNDIIPDNWVYVHDRNVTMGRFQVYNNWSPYMVKDPYNTVWLGLEYFCDEGDDFWNMPNKEIAKLGAKEIIRMGLVESKKDLLDTHVERVKKAYPAYFDTYERIDEVKDYLAQFPNIICVGRNGQHRYNNMDHSMCTSFEAVKNIKNNVTDHTNVWSVNTEAEYHEQ